MKHPFQLLSKEGMADEYLLLLGNVKELISNSRSVNVILNS